MAWHDVLKGDHIKGLHSISPWSYTVQPIMHLYVPINVIQLYLSLRYMYYLVHNFAVKVAAGLTVHILRMAVYQV